MSSQVARSGGGTAQLVAAAILGLLAYFGFYSIPVYLNYAFQNTGLGTPLPSIPPPGSAQGNNLFAIASGFAVFLLVWVALRPRTRIGQVGGFKKP